MEIKKEEEMKDGKPDIFEKKIYEALEAIGLEIYRIKTVRWGRDPSVDPMYKITAHTK